MIVIQGQDVSRIFFGGTDAILSSFGGGQSSIMRQFNMEFYGTSESFGGNGPLLPPLNTLLVRGQLPTWFAWDRLGEQFGIRLNLAYSKLIMIKKIERHHPTNINK